MLTYLLILLPVWAFLSNLSVIILIWRDKRLHNAINFLVVNLAVADLMNSLTTMPIVFYLKINENRWYLGPDLCLVMYFLACNFDALSILTLPLIAIFRLMVIVWPDTYQRLNRSPKHVFAIIACIWSAALATGVPMFYSMSATLLNEDDTDTCNIFNEKSLAVYYTFTFLFSMVVMMVVYMMIIFSLNRFFRRLSIDSEQHFYYIEKYLTLAEKQQAIDLLSIHEPNEESMKTFSQIKMIWTTVGILSVFFISWAPIWIFSLIQWMYELHPQPGDLKYEWWIEIYMNVAVFGVSSFSFNVMIYALLNGQLRNAFKQKFLNWFSPTRILTKLRSIWYR